MTDRKRPLRIAGRHQLTMARAVKANRNDAEAARLRDGPLDSATMTAALNGRLVEHVLSRLDPSVVLFFGEPAVRAALLSAGSGVCRWCAARAYLKVRPGKRRQLAALGPSRAAMLELLGPMCQSCETFSAIVATAHIETRVAAQRRRGSVMVAAVRAQRQRTRTAPEALAAAGCPEGRACDRAYTYSDLESGDPTTVLGAGHRHIEGT